ncbi:hypothetical protein PAHAL_8G182700 [Panicum hallii]|uniref:Reverse transcriptase zinc-binding domain-containing protein n=1 Tax=Panicum hallii TaxID=206008 RepID=A0A2T8I9F5_9POAL|nr:hypothetical protein PAHAL_8G182700 [Panicum hallii]
MGFRDLQSFNLARLAKQVWRLLRDPESLCARVLRARYYPDGKLLNARMKGGSSYTWQSILAGLDCFKLGYIWRVGDGTQIKIWEDNWIPGSHNMKVQTRRGNNLLSTVDELINPVVASWDVDLVRSIFEHIDANPILQIPITTGREDCVAWHYNRNGLFSVWRNLWKLQVPGKIKIFGWRALRGVMPCKAILANRHVIPERGCRVCHNGAEDIKHLIFTCDQARAVWRSIGRRTVPS